MIPATQFYGNRKEITGFVYKYIKFPTPSEGFFFYTVLLKVQLKDCASRTSIFILLKYALAAYSNCRIFFGIYYSSIFFCKNLSQNYNLLWKKVK